MSAESPRTFEPGGPFGRAVQSLAIAFAVAGGAVLAAMALMSTASIAGRWLLARPIPGDYEIAQLGTAVAVAAFLPYCALRGGHVLVDFLTAGAPPRWRAALDAVGSLAIAAIGLLLAWRLSLGMADLRRFGETTMVLAIPTWYAYAPMVASFALLGAVSLARTMTLARAAFRAGDEEEAR